MIWTAYTPPAGGITTAIKGAVCSFNDGTTPSGTHDRTLGLTDVGNPYFYIYDGATKQVTAGSAVAAGSVHHLVGTTDGSNIRIYVDGALKGTLAAGTAFSSYTNPNFCMGGGQLNNPAGAGAWNGTTILGVYANVAWTDQEVMARYCNPFSFLEWPEDLLLAMIVGRAQVIAARQTAVTVVSG